MAYDALPLSETIALYAVLGAIGIVPYLVILLSYIFVPTIQAQHPAADVMIWHVVCGLMVSVGFVAAYFMETVPPDAGSFSGSMESYSLAPPQCQAFSIYNQFFLLSGASWYLMLALDLLVALVNPWMGYSCKSWCYHTIAWTAGAVSAFVVYRFHYYGLAAMDLCWIARTTDPTQLNYANWILLFVPIIFCFMASLIVLLFASFRFARRQLDLTYRAKRRNLMQYYRYLVMYALYWTLCGVLYGAAYNQRFEGRTARHFQRAFATAFGLYPMLLLVVWSLNTHLYQNNWTCFSREHIDVERYTRSLTDHFSASLRKDLMRYTTAGIKCSVHDVATEALRSPIRRNRGSSADLVLAAAAAAVSLPIFQMEEGESLELYNEKKRLATTVYNCEYRYYEKLGFTDYAPKIFQNIREICGIDHALYEQSFADTLLERASEGKSGMLFYFTSDRRYLVKTMTKREHAFLLKILPAYHQYLLKQPNSLLCRFLGCHSMQLPVGWNKMFFVVMENVFSAGAVQERYDLKGNLSQSSRRRSGGSTTPSHSDSRASPSSTRRDLPPSHPLLTRVESRTSLRYDRDLISRCAYLYVNSTTRANLLAQVTSDCGFLQELGIMDYSCLLGVQHHDEALDAITLEALPHNAVVSEDQKTIYFLGFVDILQHYNLGWKLQHFILSFFVDKRKITALPPPEYALRFLGFLHTYVLRDINSSFKRSYGSVGTAPYASVVYENV